VDGGRLLTALAVGCEVSCRIGLALRRPMEAGGWYPPPIVAAFGAAAGAASLLGLDAVGVRDALSLVLCQATMPGEIKHSRGTVIRAVREAFPAQAAVLSALLARDGVTGFEEPLEGQAGFYALYAGGEFEPADLFDNLGNTFWIEQLTFKPWPSCRGTHPAIEMALELRATHRIDPDEIASVEVAVDEIQRMLTEPRERKQEPTTSIDAKFSIPFCTAAAFVDGAVDLDSFIAAKLTDPAVLNLACRVEARLAQAPEWQRGSGGRLQVRLRDGRTFNTAVHNASGCPERPLGEDAMLAKFVNCAGRASRPRSAKTAGELTYAVLAIEGCSDAGILFE
jgi:2-methylcitrate dehydratase PrpD